MSVQWWTLSGKHTTHDHACVYKTHHACVWHERNQTVHACSSSQGMKNHCVHGHSALNSHRGTRCWLLLLACLHRLNRPSQAML